MRAGDPEDLAARAMRLRKLFGRGPDARARRAIALAFLLSPPVAGMGDAAESWKS
jgi:hypothetical protein